MNCAQVKERLVDYLYDEMPAGARDEFTKHLETCIDCKATIADYQRTLGSARAALGGPLAQEPPARVHLAIMAAAQAAVKAAPASAKARPTADQPGFLARLWRTPWLLPAFGAASVATAVFLVRVLKNPEVLPGQHPHAIEERSLATPETLPPPEPTRARQPAAAAEAAAQAKAEGNVGETKGSGSARSVRKHAYKEYQPRTESPSPILMRTKKKGTDDPLDGLRLGEGRASEGAPSRFAEPPPPFDQAARAKDRDDLLSSVKEERKARQPEAQATEKPAANGAPALSVDLAPHSSRGKVNHLQQISGRSSFVAPPSPDPSPAAAAAPAAKGQGMGLVGAASSARATGAPPPSSPPVVLSKMKRVELVADDEDSENEGSVAKSETDEYSSHPAPTVEESTKRADRLFASEDWIAAAQAYRDLLRQFPSHKDAPKWRDRMNESNAAYLRALDAKRKKSPSDDPLNGSKQ
jgi:anti-sigma factor RsiW